MATPRYSLNITLPDGHTDSITALQFSPDGKFLASGSGDGVLLIFSTSTWKPIKRFIDVSPVSTLLWHPVFPKTLLCGYRSGDIHTVHFENHSIVDERNKVWTDKLGGSIHCIATDKTGTRVAISYGPDVALLEQHTISTWNNAQTLPEPPSFPGLDEELPTPSACALHFLDGGKLLVASYIDHGIVCWDVDSLELKWQITPRTCNISSSAVSLDEKVIIVANLYDGLDWYSIPDRTFSRSVLLHINHNVPIPVLLVDGGNTLIVGGTSGTVKILNAHTAETMQTLDHTPEDFVQALAFHLAEDDTRYIATGTSNAASIQIWTSKTESSANLANQPSEQPSMTARIARRQHLLNVALVVLSVVSMIYLPGLRALGENLWLPLLRLVAPIARYILAGVNDDINSQATHLPLENP